MRGIWEENDAMSELPLLIIATKEITAFLNDKGPVKEKCWQVIGYPSWHPISKSFPHKKVG